MKKSNIISILIVVGIILLTFVIDYNCPFKHYFHIRCAGCGGRDLVVHLMHFDIPGAFHSNQLLFISIPIVLVLLFIKYILKKEIHFKPYVYVLLMIIVVAFMVLRNIYNF